MSINALGKLINLRDWKLKLRALFLPAQFTQSPQHACICFLVLLLFSWFYRESQGQGAQGFCSRQRHSVANLEEEPSREELMGKEWRSQDITDASLSLQFSSYKYRNFQTPEERTLAVYRQLNNVFMDSLEQNTFMCGQQFLRAHNICD